MAAHRMISPLFPFRGVPVFMYHNVCSDSTSGERYTTPLPVFREHLSFLREQEFCVLPVSGLQEGPCGRNAILTFDDGLASHYELAFPALMEQRMSATFFVTTALVDAPGYVTWSQLREMSAAGMTIGSHGLEHIYYPVLPPAKAERELHTSRMTLEDRLGVPVSTFSATFGSLDRSLTDTAQRAGFRWICSSRPWLAKADANVISRLAVYCDTDLAQFCALATGKAFPLLARGARHALLQIPKRILLGIGMKISQESK